MIRGCQKNFWQKKFQKFSTKLEIENHVINLISLESAGFTEFKTGLGL